MSTDFWGIRNEEMWLVGWRGLGRKWAWEVPPSSLEGYSGFIDDFGNRYSRQEFTNVVLAADEQIEAMHPRTPLVLPLALMDGACTLPRYKASIQIPTPAPSKETSDG